MRPYFDQKTGIYHDGTGDLDERFRRKNRIQWLCLWGVVLATVLFPTVVAQIVTAIGLLAIYTMIALWFLGFNWTPRG